MDMSSSNHHHQQQQEQDLPLQPQHQPSGGDGGDPVRSSASPAPVTTPPGPFATYASLATSLENLSSVTALTTACNDGFGVVPLPSSPVSTQNPFLPAFLDPLAVAPDFPVSNGMASPLLDADGNLNFDDIHDSMRLTPDRPAPLRLDSGAGSPTEALMQTGRAVPRDVRVASPPLQTPPMPRTQTASPSQQVKPHPPLVKQQQAQQQQSGQRRPRAPSMLFAPVLGFENHVDGSTTEDESEFEALQSPTKRRRADDTPASPVTPSMPADMYLSSPLSPSSQRAVPLSASPTGPASDVNAVPSPNSKTKVCHNCGITSAETRWWHSRTKCNTCYKYKRARKKERPPSVYNRHRQAKMKSAAAASETRCINCGVTAAVEKSWSQSGQCGPCDAYEKQHGRLRVPPSPMSSVAAELTNLSMTQSLDPLRSVSAVEVAHPMEKVCSNCGVTDAVQKRWARDDKCRNCYKYKWKHNRERPPEVYNRSLDRLKDQAQVRGFAVGHRRCINCGAVENAKNHSQSKDRCNNCYKYWIRHRRERPEHVYLKHRAQQLQKLRDIDFDSLSADISPAQRRELEQIRDILSKSSEPLTLPNVLTGAAQRSPTTTS